MAATTLGVLPVFLFGALAALMRADLDFSQRRIGLAVAAFYAAAAGLSMPGGWLAERVGAAQTAALAVAVVACTMLGTAVLAQSWTHLLALMILAGAGSAFVQPAVNGMLAGAVPERRRGLVFGAKQAAVPLASTMAGLALPVLGLTLGWRGTFAVAAALGVPVLVLLVAVRHPQPARRARTRAALRGSKDLAVLALVGALGGGSANAMGAFYVDAAIGQGVGAGTAGLFLAVGGATGIVARVAWGWWTDHRAIARMPVVAGLLFAGAAGVAVIATRPAPPLLLCTTIVAYAAGWGWNGLLIAAVVDANPAAPAAATGVTQAGVYGGAVVVPALFGHLAEVGSYAVAWAVAAGLLCAAGCLAVVAARRPALSRALGGAAEAAASRPG